jgi:hypothetical protein
MSRRIFESLPLSAAPAVGNTITPGDGRFPLGSPWIPPAIARPLMAWHGGGGGGGHGGGGFAGGAGPGYTDPSGNRNGNGLGREGILGPLSLIALMVTIFSLSVAHEAMALLVIMLVIIGLPFAILGLIALIVVVARSLPSANRQP